MAKSKFDDILNARNSKSKAKAKSRDEQYIKAGFYIPKQLHRRLKTFSIEEERDMSEVLTTILENFFDDLDS
jgi:hypothetical protein